MEIVQLLWSGKTHGQSKSWNFASYWPVIYWNMFCLYLPKTILKRGGKWGANIWQKVKIQILLFKEVTFDCKRQEGAIQRAAKHNYISFKCASGSLQHNPVRVYILSQNIKISKHLKGRFKGESRSPWPFDFPTFPLVGNLTKIVVHHSYMISCRSF